MNIKNIFPWVRPQGNKIIKEIQYKMGRGQDWWDNYFLGMAEYASRASLDPSTKVGAVIIDNKRRVVSTGYNGFPRGIADDERLNDRPTKLNIVVHAEINAILFANRDLTDCSLFTFPFIPCSSVGSNCASLVIQSGIKRVVAPYSDNPRWIESFKLTRELFKEAGVELNEIS